MPEGFELEAEAQHMTMSFVWKPANCFNNEVGAFDAGWGGFVQRQDMQDNCFEPIAA